MNGNSSIKSMAIVLIVLAIFSMVLTNAPLRAAAPGSTFGYSTVGTGLDYDVAGWVAAQRVLMPNVAGAQVTMISFHVQAASGTAHVKCALYADNAGVPGALLGTTGEMAVTSAISWVDFTFATPISITANTYYWLSYMMDAQIQFTVQGSGALAYAAKSGVSYPSFSNPFGIAMGGYPNSVNLYATYTVPEQPTPTPTPTPSPTPTPTATPTPSPTPTPTSTPTPTPTPITTPSSTNLAVIPGAWYLGGPSWSQTADYSVFHTNSPSIRVDAHNSLNPFREVDSKQDFSVHPGDHMIFRCWVKTGHSTLGQDGVANNGAILNWDWYGANGRLHDHSTNDPYYDSCDDSAQLEGKSVGLPFNSDWTQLTLDCIVPSQVYNDNTGGFGTPTSIVLCPCVSWYNPATGGRIDDGIAWFADAELYINPSETPVSTPIPQPSAQYWYLKIVSSTGGATSPPAGSQQILVGNSQTVTATANPNYVFSYWLLNGTQYDTKATTTVTSYSSQTITLKPIFTYVPRSRWR